MSDKLKIWIIVCITVLIISLMNPHFEGHRRDTSKVIKVNKIRFIPDDWEITDYKCSEGILKGVYMSCTGANICMGNTCDKVCFHGNDGFCKIDFKKTYYDFELF